MKKSIVVLAAIFLLAGAPLLFQDKAYAAECQVPAPDKTETIVFYVDMHCKSCVQKITENISFEKGVKDLAVNLDTKTVRVTFNPEKTSMEKLIQAFKKLGYTATCEKPKQA